MKGVICPDPSWVASVNAAFESFRPSADVVFTVARDALLERGIQAYAVHVP